MHLCFLLFRNLSFGAGQGKESSVNAWIFSCLSKRATKWWELTSVTNCDKILQLSMFTQQEAVNVLLCLRDAISLTAVSLYFLFWEAFCRKTVSDLTFFQVVAGSECMLLAFQHPLLSPYLSWKHRHKYSYLAPGYLSGHWDNFCECKQNLLTENLSDGGLGRILWIADIPVSSPFILNDLCPPRFSLCPSKSFGQVSYVMFRITRIRIRFRITPQVSSHDSPAEPFQSFYSHIRCLQLQRFILCKTNQIVFQLRLKSSFWFSTRAGFFVSQFEKSPHFPFSRSNIRFPPVFAPSLMTASCVHWQQFFEPKQSSHDHICNIFTFVTALLVFPLSYQPHIDAISNWFRNKRNKSQLSFTESLETDLHRWLGKGPVNASRHHQDLQTFEAAWGMLDEDTEAKNIWWLFTQWLNEIVNNDHAWQCCEAIYECWQPKQIRNPN